MTSGLLLLWRKLARANKNGLADLEKIQIGEALRAG